MNYCSIEKPDCEFIAKYCDHDLIRIKKLYNDNFEPYMLEMILENSNRERFICQLYENEIMISSAFNGLAPMLKTNIEYALREIEQNHTIQL